MEVHMQNKDNKLKAFIKKQGLYISLALAIGAVGTSAYILTKNEEEEKPLSRAEEVQKQNSETLKEALRSRAPAATAKPEPSLDIVALESTPMPSASEEASPTPGKLYSAKEKLAMPVKGSAYIKSFSGDKFSHFESMGAWMTHNGVDISANENSDVMAALSGTVCKVSDDAVSGWLIEIEHSGGKKTLYAGLSEVSVAVGDKVNRKDLIGKSGTPPFEAASGPHLHFELMIDGEYRDPVKYFE